MAKKQLSDETIKALSTQSLQRLINQAKDYLKKDSVWIDLCKEYNVDPQIIDLIPTKFGELDVSAKTDHGIVILNYQLLRNGEFFDNYSYLIHEYTHWMQQCLGDKPTQSSDDGNYLENPYEEEGFQNQIDYISDHLGEEEAEEYVDQLLDHHEVKKKDKAETKETLMAKV